MKSYAVVLAGGSGVRMESEQNKVLLRLRGVPAIVRAIAPFTSLCAGAVVVARQDELALMRELLDRYGLSRFARSVVAGGDTRQASVARGLSALPEDAGIVLVHDGARAFVTEEVIARVIASVETRGSGVAAVPVNDSVKRADADGKVVQTIERDGLFAMQTPQGFRLADLRQAHERAAADGYLATDDAALLEHMGAPVFLTRGDPENMKLTIPDDLYRAEAILSARAEREALQ